MKIFYKTRATAAGGRSCHTALDNGSLALDLAMPGSGKTGTVGVPGSGLSYRETLSSGSSGNPGPARSRGLVRVVFWLAAIALVAFLFGR